MYRQTLAEHFRRLKQAAVDLLKRHGTHKTVLSLQIQGGELQYIGRMNDSKQQFLYFLLSFFKQ